MSLTLLAQTAIDLIDIDFLQKSLWRIRQLFNCHEVLLGFGS